MADCTAVSVDMRVEASLSALFGRHCVVEEGRPKGENGEERDRPCRQAFGWLH